MLPKKNINKKYKILILGGGSYIAGFFVKLLLETNYIDLTVFNRTKLNNIPKSIQKNFEIFKNKRIYTIIKKEKYDLIYNFLNCKNNNIYQNLQINYFFNISLINFVLENKIKSKIIFIGSASEYFFC